VALLLHSVNTQGLHGETWKVQEELNFVKANWVSRLNNRIEMYFSWRDMERNEWNDKTKDRFMQRGNNRVGQKQRVRETGNDRHF